MILTGSLRYNLDPHEQASDADIWDMLGWIVSCWCDTRWMTVCVESVGLASAVGGMPRKLDTPISEEKCCLSQGQQQVFSICVYFDALLNLL
jgi:ABC-type multidrug transport system fused ATPase/permease subunit